MGARASVRLLAAGAAWRVTGLAAAGHTLVKAATAGQETERTLAGMLLVQAGDRSVPVVTDAIRIGRDPAVLTEVLASIGTNSAREALRRVSQTDAPAVSDEARSAAADALRMLDEIRRREGGPS